MNNTKLNTYQNMVSEMYISMEKAIGSHVVQILIEHAHWQTKQKYEEAKLIKCSAEGISFDDLREIATEKKELIAHEFVMQIVAGLGRLVGKEMANKLTLYLEE